MKKSLLYVEARTSAMSLFLANWTLRIESEFCDEILKLICDGLTYINIRAVLFADAGHRFIILKLTFLHPFNFILFSCRNLGLGRRCYYDNNGEFTPGPPSVITNQTLQAGASVFLFFWEEILPYQECCMFPDNCMKYQDLGVSENEARYVPPNIGKCDQFSGYKI